jgi:hypothetical protein
LLDGALAKGFLQGDGWRECIMLPWDSNVR